MAVPSRKNRMMQTIMKNQVRDKEKLNPKKEEKEVSDEEHKDRLEKLKAIGLMKKD